jgi:hypothetical protein
MYRYAYTLDKSGRRVLIGLTFDETREFELLEASLPMNGTPVPSVVPTAAELRWFELFNKHDRSRLKAPARPESGKVGKRSFTASTRP